MPSEQQQDSSSDTHDGGENITYAACVRCMVAPAAAYLSADQQLATWDSSTKDTHVSMLELILGAFGPAQKL
jgi:hypothetical protein